MYLIFILPALYSIIITRTRPASLTGWRARTVHPSYGKCGHAAGFRIRRRRRPAVAFCVVPTGDVVAGVWWMVDGV